MPLQIAFEAEAGDRGRLRVGALPQLGPEVLVAVQRLSDDRYLTMHGRWDEAASWFPCPRLDADGATVRFATSAALTAGIRDAGREPLRAHLRRRDFADVGPLEVKDPASAGVVAADPPAAPATPAPRAATPSVHPSERLAPPPPPGLARPDPAPAARAPDGRPRIGGRSSKRGTGTDSDSAAAHRWIGGRRAVLALCLVGLAALTWWYRTAATLTPVPTAPPPPGPVADGPAGKTLAADLQRQALPPAELFARAEQAEQAGDCEAAIRLFVSAAKRDPASAQGLARRYDPADRQPSPCFPAPKPDSALVWYQRAAEAGIPQAQRRYGELLLGETNAGPVYREAVGWLRKAAAAGDTAAAGRLAALAER